MIVDLGTLRTVVAALPAAAADADRIDRLRQLEELKSTIAAVQARETAAFVASQRAAQAAQVPADRIGRGIAAQIALARRISPHQAQRYAGWSGVLVAELPETFAALERGETSEWRAMLIARETIFLSRADRARVDAEIAPTLAGSGDRRVETEARKIAYRLDPVGFTERSRAAANDRRVSLRPAPDTMCRLTALLPVAQGVAAFAALSAEADTRIGTGDTRGRGQVMADTLVERVTGQAAADAVPVEVNLLMTDETLLGGRGPAHLDGYGPVPAPLARRLVRDAETVMLRRLFRAPTTGELAALESRARLFTTAQRRFLRLRDHGVCRTPYCDASIRHYDHVVPVDEGGVTGVGNGQGLCVACNHAKQAVGWRSRVRGHDVTIITPTRHVYRHRPPDPPPRGRVPLTRHVADVVYVA